MRDKSIGRYSPSVARLKESSGSYWASTPGFDYCIELQA